MSTALSKQLSWPEERTTQEQERCSEGKGEGKKGGEQSFGNANILAEPSICD